jgi:hypothetical protein
MAAIAMGAELRELAMSLSKTANPSTECRRGSATKYHARCNVK